MSTGQFRSRDVSKRVIAADVFCHLCCEAPATNAVLVIPRSMGGRRRMSNAVGACDACAVAVAGRTPREAGLRLRIPRRWNPQYEQIALAAQRAAKTAEHEAVVAARCARTAMFRAIRRADVFCHYCLGGSASTVDHIIPTSRGGSDHPRNLVGCCELCNAEKADRTPREAGMVLRVPARFFSPDALSVTPRARNRDLACVTFRHTKNVAS